MCDYVYIGEVCFLVRLVVIIGSMDSFRNVVLIERSVDCSSGRVVGGIVVIVVSSISWGWRSYRIGVSSIFF